MSEQLSQPVPQRLPAQAQPHEISRPIFVRRVPEPIWIRVHENALKSRLRLQAYLVRLMADCEPFPPQPTTGPAATMVASTPRS
jgi:hypothetical protein